MSDYIKTTELTAYIEGELNHHLEEYDEACSTCQDERRINGLAVLVMQDRYAKAILQNVKHYEFDDQSAEDILYWEEMGGEDKGFHCCPRCKKQAFNYDDVDTGDVIEVLSDYCPNCGKRLKAKEE